MVACSSNPKFPRAGELYGISVGDPNWRPYLLEEIDNMPSEEFECVILRSPRPKNLTSEASAISPRKSPIPPRRNTRTRPRRSPSLLLFGCRSPPWPPYFPCPPPRPPSSLPLHPPPPSP